VSNRRTAGGTASGPAAGAPAAADSGETGYPGQRFGLPEEGPRSVAGVGRRLGALIIDWLACTALSLAFFRSQTWTFAFFAAESWILTALTGYTLGKRVLGIRVARLDGRPVGFTAALIRTVLLLLVVPALIFNKDLRALHERASNTVVLRT
jgi:uncharacterized RDD family membrane protein YckC